MLVLEVVFDGPNILIDANIILFLSFNSCFISRTKIFCIKGFVGGLDLHLIALMVFGKAEFMSFCEVATGVLKVGQGRGSELLVSETVAGEITAVFCFDVN